MYKEISDTKKSQVITEGEIIMTKNILKNKIDFVAFISVRGANPNGDPNNENLPRTDDEMYGEMSSGCIHRKIRNRMQDMGHKIYVQSEERTDDGYVCLSDRAKALFSEPNNIDKCREEACEKWLDIRAFGQVFALPKGNVSFGVRGPVTTHEAYSIDPVVIDTYGITKSVNALPPKNETSMSSDRMGSKSCVKYGLYVLKGAINVQMARKTGFTEDDAEIVKKALATLFVNDASAARPEGSMEVVKLYWFKHNNETGQYSSAQVHRSVTAHLKDGCINPKSIDDYEIVCNELPGLACEDVEGTC